MIRSNTARLFVENSDARLAGIVIWTDCPLFENLTRGASNPWKLTKLTIYVLKKMRGVIFLRSPKPAAGNDDQPLRAGMCSYMFIYVYICLYMSVYVRICHICPNTSIYVHIYVHTCQYWRFFWPLAVSRWQLVKKTPSSYTRVW